MASDDMLYLNYTPVIVSMKCHWLSCVHFIQHVFCSIKTCFVPFSTMMTLNETPSFVLGVSIFLLPAIIDQDQDHISSFRWYSYFDDYIFWWYRYSTGKLARPRMMNTVLTCIPYNSSVISLHQFWWHILCYLPAANDAMLASFLCELVDDREVESVRYIYIRK